MATIKLTGFNTATARIGTAGDTDTVVNDGSMTIGDADTDTIIVNAEFDSDLIPDDTDTYDLGSASKVWSSLHATTIHVGGGAYELPISDGNANEVLATNGDGQVSFQPIGNLNAPSFLVYGQNGVKSNQTSDYELKTTNGSENTQGWRMPVGGSVTHLSVQFICTSHTSTANFVIELMKNGVLTGQTSSVSVTGSGNFGANNTITAQDFVAGDCLGLVFRHSVTGITTGDIAALIRILTSAS